MPSESSYSGWKPPKEEGEHPWKRENKDAVLCYVVGHAATNEESVTMRDKVVPSCVQAGYDVRYVESIDWTGPSLLIVPHLFYYDPNDVLTVQTVGIKTKREVIKYLADPA